MALFLTSALEGGEGLASRLGRTLPPEKTRYPLYRGLGGPQGRSGQVRKISPPPEFDLRTVQPVGSRYTDYATRPTFFIITRQRSNACTAVTTHNPKTGKCIVSHAKNTSALQPNIF